MSYMEGLAMVAYSAYLAVVGATEPPWEGLSELERFGWRAAIRAVLGRDLEA